MSQGSLLKCAASSEPVNSEISPIANVSIKRNLCCTSLENNDKEEADKRLKLDETPSLNECDDNRSEIKSSLWKRGRKGEVSVRKKLRIEGESGEEIKLEENEDPCDDTFSEIPSISENGPASDNDEDEENIKPKKGTSKALLRSKPSNVLATQSSSNIMKAIQLSETDPNLIGDFSRPHALPIITGKHNDLKTISSDTLAHLIRGHYKECIDNYTIIDGRYPYEFEGGHIIGAINIYTKNAIIQEMFDNQENLVNKSKDGKAYRHVLIFHCEFSSERGPSLFRFLRNKDRELNNSRYPHLYHPEVYLLDGGYKAFFQKYKKLCSPQQYVTMTSKEHKELMKFYKNKSKKSNLEANSKMSTRSRLLPLRGI